jgi:hypothetical protein
MLRRDIEIHYKRESFYALMLPTLYLDMPVEKFTYYLN